MESVNRRGKREFPGGEKLTDYQYEQSAGGKKTVSDECEGEFQGRILRVPSPTPLHTHTPLYREGCIQQKYTVGT